MRGMKLSDEPKLARRSILDLTFTAICHVTSGPSGREKQ
jgi:hypothetical protein